MLDLKDPGYYLIVAEEAQYAERIGCQIQSRIQQQSLKYALRHAIDLIA